MNTRIISGSVLCLMVIVFDLAASSAIQEVNAPDLSTSGSSRRTEIWRKPGKFKEVPRTPILPRNRKRTPLTLQQQVKKEKNFGDMFLNGVSSFSSLIDEDRYTRQSSSSGVDSGLIGISANKNQAVTSSNEGEYDGDDNILFENSDDKVITPTSVRVSDDRPPPGLDGQKCQYVQMKGNVTDNDCVKGGMTCERKCSTSMTQEECTQVMKTVCEDVPKEECKTVPEKSCKTIQEEICDNQEDPVTPKMKCDVVLDEECRDISEPLCRNVSRMECSTVDKEACTTMVEQECRPKTDRICEQVPQEKCNLLQDVICRNITETRFEEKCWTIEDEVCRTVYDTVWENKCEMVNVTVPQKDCEVKEEFTMEEVCEISNDTVKMPVCTTVTEMIPEEMCDEEQDEMQCFAQNCTMVPVQSFEKECMEVTEESCEVIIEQGMEKKCQDVESTEYSEECTDQEETECSTVQEYVCEEVQAAVQAPSSDYGAPQAPVLTQASLPTYSSSQFQQSRTPRVKSDIYGRWRRKSQLSKTEKNSRRKRSEEDSGEKSMDDDILPDDVIRNEDDIDDGGVTETPATETTKGIEATELPLESRTVSVSLPIGDRRSGDDNDDDGRLDLEELFEITESEDLKKKLENMVKVAEVEDKVFERAANWYNTHPKFGGIGGVFQKLGNSQYQANFYGSPKDKGVTNRPYAPQSQPVVVTPTTAVPTASSNTNCNYVDREVCKPVTKNSCRQVPMKVTRTICVDYPVAKPRQECKQVPREECQIKERTNMEERCGVYETPRSVRRQCQFKLREETRESCQDVDMTVPQKICKMVPKSNQKVECESKLKAIQLKEICVDIDIQLPREECKKEEREECRYQPFQETVTRCEPTVREECVMEVKEVCRETCSENCQDQERRICMTIPQQECVEKVEEKCEEVTRKECSTVPKENCKEMQSNEVTSSGCRVNTRLDCTETPREKCSRTFVSECRQKPTQKCTDRKSENCAMSCEPVYWCKMCR